MKAVYLSPSTQEKNIGVEGYKSEEYRMNQVADIVEKELKRHGVVVYRNQPNMTLGQVVNDSNSKNADIHFAIHSNAFNKISRGCEIFCFRKGGEGEKLSKEVYKYISDLTPTADRGIKEGYNFYGAGKHMYEVYKTKVPASLIEIAFHDNVADANWIINNIELIGIGITKGILDYFNIKYIENEIEKNKFPVTTAARDILKKISPYASIWIEFFEKNEHVNLSGLIENLYNKFIDADTSHKMLLSTIKAKVNELESYEDELKLEINELLKIKAKIDELINSFKM